MNNYYILLVMVFGLIKGSAQSTVTYTVDNDFDVGQKFRSGGSVSDLFSLDDGGYFAAGSFQTMFTNPDSPFPYGGGMITANGGVHPDWEDGTVIAAIRELHDYQGGYIFSGEFGQAISKMTYTGISWYATHGEYWADYFRPSNAEYTNPYNVAWGWDVYIQDDEKVLIAGSIATDTLQPNIYRHLTRVLPDGSHDDSFPAIEASPVNPSTYISEIYRASDGYWYVSGNFEGINGHVSPHIARLTPDFAVDPTFVSPLFFELIGFGLHTGIIHLDEDDRPWLGGRQVKLQSDPEEVLHLVRLLPSGEVDPTFESGKLSSDLWDFGFQRPPRVSKIVRNGFGHYYVLGSFSHYNDTAQLCITAIDDSGVIQNNYFEGEGPSTNFYDANDETSQRRPSLDECLLLEDGSLLIGGAFSNFMGVEKYSIVKLNQGTVSTEDRSRPEGIMKLYPNPADQYIRLEYDLLFAKERTDMRVYDQLGRLVTTYTIGLNTKGVEILDTRKLTPGVYIVEIVQEGRQVFSDKFIVQH